MAKKLTPDEIATLKIFAKYASEGGKNKSGSKGFQSRLSDLTSNISYERAKTKQPVVAAKPVVAKPVVPKKETLKETKNRHKAEQRAKNAARLVEIARYNAAQRAKVNPDGTKKK